MREVMESSLRCAWAMSMFGVQQGLNSFRRPGPGTSHPFTAALTSVGEAIRAQSAGTPQQVNDALAEPRSTAVVAPEDLKQRDKCGCPWGGDALAKLLF